MENKTGDSIVFILFVMLVISTITGSFGWMIGAIAIMGVLIILGAVLAGLVLLIEMML